MILALLESRTPLLEISILKKRQEARRGYRSRITSKGDGGSRVERWGKVGKTIGAIGGGLTAAIGTEFLPNMIVRAANRKIDKHAKFNPRLAHAYNRWGTRARDAASIIGHRAFAGHRAILGGMLGGAVGRRVGRGAAHVANAVSRVASPAISAVGRVYRAHSGKLKTAAKIGAGILGAGALYKGAKYAANRYRNRGFSLGKDGVINSTNYRRV